MKFALTLAALSVAATLSAAPRKTAPARVAIVRSGSFGSKDPNPTASFRAHRGQTIAARVRSKTRGYVPLLFITSPSGRNLTQSKETAYSATAKESGLYRVRIGTNFMASENSGRSAYTLKILVR